MKTSEITVGCLKLKKDGLVRVAMGDMKVFVGEDEIPHQCNYPYELIELARAVAGYDPRKCNDDEFPILI